MSAKKIKDHCWTYGVARFWDGTLAVVEVYFENGKPWGWTRAEPQGDTMKELRDDLRAMARAVAVGPRYGIDKKDQICGLAR